MGIPYRITSVELPLMAVLIVFKPVGESFFCNLPTFEMDGDSKSDLRFADSPLALFGVRAREALGFSSSNLDCNSI